MTAIEYIKRIKDPVIRECLTNDILSHPNVINAFDSNTQVESIKDAINCISWGDTKAGVGYYMKLWDYPPDLLPVPTEREREEELLREFAEWYNDQVPFSDQYINTDYITDFLNDKHKEQ